MKSLRRCALVVLALAGLAACDLPLPPGSYEPEPVDLGAGPAEAGMASPDSSVGIPGGTMGGEQDSGVGGTDADAGMADPLQALTGDYYVRVDQYNTSKASGLTVQSRVISYFVAKLLLVDGALTMYDRQCYIEFNQEGATTSIPVSEQTNYYPAKRAVKVVFETGTWRTERGPFAVGWDYDFSTQPPRPTPTSESDPLVRDNNKDGAGVNVTVTSGLTCNLRVVQTIDLTFSGTLVGGKLASGTCANKSVQETLYKDFICPSESELLSNGPDTMRFAKARDPVADTLPCPTRSVIGESLPSL